MTFRASGAGELGRQRLKSHAGPQPGADTPEHVVGEATITQPPGCLPTTHDDLLEQAMDPWPDFDPTNHPSTAGWALIELQEFNATKRGGR